MKSICIIVPVFNEEKNLSLLLNEIDKNTIDLNYHWSLLFVDDGSSDLTWENIRKLIHPKIKVMGIRLTRNFGKETALMAGVDACESDAAILMDADLQHPPSLIPKLTELWGKGEYKIVEGVKQDRGNEFIFYRWAAQLYYNLISRWSGYSIKNSSDFKLLDRSVLDAIKTVREKNVFFRGVTAWSGFPSVKVEFAVQERHTGGRQMSLGARIQLAVLSIVSFTTAPLKWIFKTALVFILSSFIFAVYSLYLKFYGDALPGFTTVIILQLFIGGALLFALGIIGGYLARIYEEVKARPRYLILDKKE